MLAIGLLIIGFWQATSTYRLVVCPLRLVKGKRHMASN